MLADNSGNAKGLLLHAARPQHDGQLVSRLRKPTVEPDEWVVHLLAVCSGYAYSKSTATVEEMAGRAGFTGAHCREITQYADAMLIDSAAMLLHGEQDRVAILAYRGTPPMSAITWMTDFDVYANRAALYIGGQHYPAHDGFVRNTLSTYAIVADALSGLAPNIDAIYITGHSLGAAMAVICALMLLNDLDESRVEALAKLKGVYTFGQPMIGDRDLADAAGAQMSRAGIPLHRYVYRRDVVPHLPPRIAGKFAHFGEEHTFTGTRWRDSTARPAGQMPCAIEFLDLPLSLLGMALPFVRDSFFSYSLGDHFPSHYVGALDPKV